MGRGVVFLKKTNPKSTTEKEKESAFAVATRLLLLSMTIQSVLGVVVRSGSKVILVRQLLQSLALGLGNQEGDNETDEHEQGKDLEQLGDEGVGTTAILQLRETNLGNDGAQLAGTGGDTVTGGTVTGREDLTGDDEGGRVGSEVLEELGGGKEEDEEGDRVVADLVVGETEDAEKDAGHDETENLDLDASQTLNGEDSDPVTGDGTQENNDDLTDSGVPASGPVITLNSREVDGRQNERVVQTNTVEGNIESEPSHGGTEKDLEVLPLGEVGAEVSEGALGDGGVMDNDLGIILGLEVVAVLLEDGGDITLGLVDVVLDIEDIAGGLGDGQAEVDGNEGGDASEADEDTPDVVQVGRVGNDLVLEGRQEDDGNDASGQVTESLHGKDSGHHGTATVGGGKLGSDDGRQGVITTNTDTDNDTPDDKSSGERQSVTVSREGLTKGGDNDNHQLDTVHFLATKTISQVTESNLTHEGADRGRDLDTEIQISGESTAIVNDSQHGSDQVNGEEIVSISEETDTGNQTGADVEPAELGVIDFAEGFTTTLVELVGVQLVVVGGHDGGEGGGGVWM